MTTRPTSDEQKQNNSMRYLKRTKIRLKPWQKVGGTGVHNLLIWMILHDDISCLWYSQTTEREGTIVMKSWSKLAVNMLSPSVASINLEGECLDRTYLSWEMLSFASFHFFSQLYLIDLFPIFFSVSYRVLRLVCCAWGRRGEWVGKWVGRKVVSYFALILFFCSQSGSFGNRRAILVITVLQWPGGMDAKCSTIFVRALKNEEFSHPKCSKRPHSILRRSLKGETTGSSLIDILGSRFALYL